MSDEQDKKDLEAAAALIANQLDKQGYSSALVKGGRLWLFSRDFLQNLLTKYPDEKEFHILIQEREFKN